MLATMTLVVSGSQLTQWINEGHPVHTFDVKVKQPIGVLFHYPSAGSNLQIMGGTEGNGYKAGLKVGDIVVAAKLQQDRYLIFKDGPGGPNKTALVDYILNNPGTVTLQVLRIPPTEIRVATDAYGAVLSAYQLHLEDALVENQSSRFPRPERWFLSKTYFRRYVYLRVTDLSKPMPFGMTHQALAEMAATARKHVECDGVKVTLPKRFFTDFKPSLEMTFALLQKCDFKVFELALKFRRKKLAARA